MATTTTDHETIRNWIQERGGVPATVEGTAGEGEDAGILRVDFPDPGGDDGHLMTISWEEFFAKFDGAQLGFLHDEKTADGEISRFCKFISR